MIKKQGITVTMLVVTIIMLTILTGTVVFSMNSAINYSKLYTWTNEIIYIQDVVNEQMHKTSVMDYILEDITINVSNIKEVNEQFKGEAISEDNNVVLKVLDLGKLKITNTIYGNLNTDADVYAVSEQTGKVYYVQGLEAEDKTYYCIIDSLRQKFELATSPNNLSSIVFVPSVIGYTNQAITVLVKVPNTFTDIIITSSNNNIVIGEQEVKETTYEYIVNSGETPVASNYTINVSYNDGTQTLVSTYEVNGYDMTAPIIAPITDSNFVYKSKENQEVNYIGNIIATDESGIKFLKYELGTIAEENAKSYFVDNGYLIIGGKINLGENIKQYTIYAEDNAGNFSIQTVNIEEKAYAMYSSTDNSLTFIRTDKKIKVGDLYNKKEITALYTGFETATYANATDVPWYNYATNIISVTVEDTIRPVSTQRWFQNFSNCATLNLEKFDTSKVTNMAHTFYNTGSSKMVTNFKVVGLDNWNTSNVTNMGEMFENTGLSAATFDIGNLSDWDVSNVQNMRGMFKYAGSTTKTTFDIGDLGKWNTASVNDMGWMFQKAGTAAENWNIGQLDNWNTAGVTDMAGMFFNAAAQAKEFNIGVLGGWDVLNVTNMQSMFQSAGKLADYYLDLSTWDVSNVTSYDNFSASVSEKIKLPPFK